MSIPRLPKGPGCNIQTIRFSSQPMITVAISAPFDASKPFYILLGCIGLMLLLAVLSIFLPGLQRRESNLDARFWKFGVLYTNPADPAIFVPKRFGIGYTLNFARPSSWLIFALILLAALAPLFYALHSLPTR